ncbi:hypothetical protein Esti_005648 [Eimeria stiedai]
MPMDHLSLGDIHGTFQGPPTEETTKPLNADMFLNFVDPASLLLLPPREAAEALISQHRERLTLVRQQQQQQQQQPRAAGAYTPLHKRLRTHRRAAGSSRCRLSNCLAAPPSMSDEGPLLALERGLVARNTLHRLRQQVLELPNPNRHGVALIYGARMSSNDGHDYRVIYWGEVHGSTKEEKMVNKRNAQQKHFYFLPLQFRSLIGSLAEASPDRCLTVQQLVLDLDVNMSKGWVHFAKLALPGKLDPYSEFLLRRKREDPQTQQ